MGTVQAWVELGLLTVWVLVQFRHGLSWVWIQLGMGTVQAWVELGLYTVWVWVLGWYSVVITLRY